MAGKSVIAGLKNNYDKILAFLVLVILLGSMVYLAIRVGTLRRVHEELDAEIRGMKPKHEKCGALDTKKLEQADASLNSPLQASAESWSNALFTSDTRVWCTDCKRPIGIQIAVTQGSCPFCSKQQPKDPGEDDKWDGDGDTIPDRWESQHGMNAMDASDAQKDPDDDGFSSLDEFLAQTDPMSVTSSPPIEVKIQVERIEAIPFSLLFKSRLKLPDGQYKFGFNTRVGGQTYFARINDTNSPLYTKEGFLVTQYKEEKSSLTGGVSVVRDASTVVLKRGSKVITLRYQQDVLYDDLVAHLVFAVDGSKYQVRSEDTTEIRGRKYKVLSIDSAQHRVLIRNLQDNREITIGKVPEDTGKPKTVGVATNAPATSIEQGETSQ